jgi:hypothetical protein
MTRAGPERAAHPGAGMPRIGRLIPFIRRLARRGWALVRASLPGLESRGAGIARVGEREQRALRRKLRATSPMQFERAGSRITRRDA